MPLNKFAGWGPLPASKPSSPGIARNLRISKTGIRAYSASGDAKLSAVGFLYRVVERGDRQTYVVTLDARELGVLVGTLLRSDKTSASAATFHEALAKALVS